MLSKDSIQNNVSSRRDTLSMELECYLKPDCWEIIERNGWKLPSKTCHWLTKRNMIAMACGYMFCPRYDELKEQPCVSPPVKEVLIEYLNKEISKRIGPSKVLPWHKQRIPDRDWLISALSCLNPNHEIFAKDYDSKKMDPNDEQLILKKKDMIKQMGLVRHPFFKGLPPRLLCNRKGLKN